MRKIEQIFGCKIIKKELPGARVAAAMDNKKRIIVLISKNQSIGWQFLALIWGIFAYLKFRISNLIALLRFGDKKIPDQNNENLLEQQIEEALTREEFDETLAKLIVNEDNLPSEERESILKNIEETINSSARKKTEKKAKKITKIQTQLHEAIIACLSKYGIVPGQVSDEEIEVFLHSPLLIKCKTEIQQLQKQFYSKLTPDELRTVSHADMIFGKVIRKIWGA